MPNTANEFSDSYILLDRSGSMQTRWTEALSSINAYVSELKGTKNARITLAAFDNHMGNTSVELIDDATPIDDYRDVTIQDVSPRGGTPLYDALGQLVTIANKNNSKRSVIVVMTDGEENASREYTAASSKALLDACEKKGWQVLFLGADFNNWAQAQSVGRSFDKTLSFASANAGSMMRSTAMKSKGYFETGADINYTAQDRTEAAK